MSLKYFEKVLPSSYHYLSGSVFSIYNQPVLASAIFTQALRSKTKQNDRLLLARQFRESFLRSGIFGGMSKAINSLQELHKVMPSELKEPVKPMHDNTQSISDLHAQGSSFLAQVYDGERGANIQTALQTISPRLGHYAVDLVYGGIYSDTSALSLEAACVCMFTYNLAVDTPKQAIGHIESSLRHGATKDDLLEVGKMVRLIAEMYDVKLKHWMESHTIMVQTTLADAYLRIANDDDLSSDGLNPQTTSSDKQSDVERKTAQLRDTCMKLLKALQSKLSFQVMAAQLETLPAQLERHIALQTKLKKYLFPEDFDSIGTELWNLAHRVSKRAASHDQATLCHLRYAALLMIELGRSSAKDLGGTTRLLGVCLKAATHCQASGVPALAQKVVAKASMLQSALMSPAMRKMEGYSAVKTAELSVDLFVTRYKLERAQKNFDVAEFALRQAISASELARIDTTKSLSVAETSFDLGTECLRSNELDKAIDWLSETHKMIISQEEEMYADLQVCTMENLARAHLRRNKDDDLQRVQILLDQAHEHYPVASWLYCLKLEFLAVRHETNEAFTETLNSMIRVVQLNGKVFNAIMHKIHDLHTRDMTAAIQALDYLMPKIVDTGEVEWLERALVTRIWIATQVPEDKHSAVLVTLQDMLARLEQQLTRPLSAKAEHACLTFLWKTCESLFERKLYAAAMAWCALGQASIFKTVSDVTKSRFLRKTASCYLEQGDYTNALATLQRLPASAFATPMTRYLLFRVQLNMNDTQALVENLNKLVQCHSFDVAILFHCAKAAEQIGNQRVLLIIFEKIRDLGKQSEMVRKPALLRSIVRLLTVRLDAEPQEPADVLKVLDQFQVVASMVKTPEACIANNFNTKELGWFSLAAHNLAVKNIKNWSLEHLTQLLAACQTILEAYTPSPDPHVNQDVAARLALCSYLSVCAYYFASRSEQDEVKKMAFSQSMCKQSSVFRHALVRWQAADTKAQLPDDLCTKMATILIFEFEARIYVQDWHELSSLIELANKYGIAQQTLAAMADLTLSSRMPTETMLKILDGVSQATLNSPAMDIKRVAKWYRVLFTTVLKHDQSTGLQYASKLLKVIRSHASTYPSDEIHWLAGKAFNHAVDLHVAGQTDACHSWCDVALSLANLTNDETLKETIQQNFQQLLNTGGDT
ncbi:meiosis protein SPO22/ZIP4 like-domain-containing protein [Protomyces lactucae-debilis]|uniref:Protein ZIP4 homolog n=1 Tax=Protomyces lactucae-debilis TaxID=2754530 RepID=A0A1Y2FDE8_PROLT|nr:meiosis protein SPO22/ZIP4 like-domain-containing protein [Protomyces lactucae-debilis]ORY80875.1 meiosis protein SPO22/ZIP4 like-domain-containing protein [Protomyces lactucae-debilis]